MFNQTTDLPYYDDMLGKPDYYRKTKNAAFIILNMPPAKYLYLVADMQKTNVDRQREMAHQPSLAWFASQVEMGKKLPLPIIDYITDGQEGRSRAVLAEWLGLKSLPVMVVYEPNNIPIIVKEKFRGDYYSGRITAKQYVKILAHCIEADFRRRQIIGEIQELMKGTQK